MKIFSKIIEYINIFLIFPFLCYLLLSSFFHVWYITYSINVSVTLERKGKISIFQQKIQKLYLNPIFFYNPWSFELQLKTRYPEEGRISIGYSSSAVNFLSAKYLEISRGNPADIHYPHIGFPSTKPNPATSFSRQISC